MRLFAIHQGSRSFFWSSSVVFCVCDFPFIWYKLALVLVLFRLVVLSGLASPTLIGIIAGLMHGLSSFLICAVLWHVFSKLSFGESQLNPGGSRKECLSSMCSTRSRRLVAIDCCIQKKWVPPHSNGMMGHTHLWATSIHIAEQLHFFHQGRHVIDQARSCHADLAPALAATV